MNFHDSDNHLSGKMVRETGNGATHETIAEEPGDLSGWHYPNLCLL
ncbi:MAG: hypothetical protein OPY04_00430 [Nitrosopumilus sp.]|nr:hypothetical protein [Nitrosopumilus sp.]